MKKIEIFCQFLRFLMFLFFHVLMRKEKKWEKGAVEQVAQSPGCPLILTLLGVFWKRRLFNRAVSCDVAGVTAVEAKSLLAARLLFVFGELALAR